MTQYVINIGALPNDGTGDPLRTAFNDTNLNFNQIFAAGPVLSNVQIANNTILTTNTNGNLVLAPNGTGNIIANVNILPNTSNIRSLGSAARRWDTLYVQYANVSGNLDLAGEFSVGDMTVTGNLTVTGNTIQIGNIVTETLTIQLANAASTANAANGSGITVGANDNIATMLYSSTSNTWTTNIGISATGNVTGSNVVTGGVVSATGNVRGANFNTVGTVSATGNITGNYFIGNGSQLTGLPAGYANANAVAYGEAGWAGNIIPTGNAVYSLGNATNQWSDLYVSNATIYMNNVPISLTAGNVLTVDGADVVTTSAAGQANIGNLDITGTYVSIAAGADETIITISPNIEGQAYLQIPNDATANTANTRLHNDAGNIELGTGSGSYNWYFDNAGNLSVPVNINFNGGGLQQVVNEDFYVRASDDESDGWSIYNVIDDGAGNTLSQTRLEYNQYTIRTDAQGSAYTWAFRDTGVLDLPGDIYGNVGNSLTIRIGDQAGSDTFIDLQTRSYVGDALISNIRIANPNVTVSTANAAYNWTFGNTGTLTLPNGANIADGNLNAGSASASVALNAFSPDGNTVSIQAQGNSSSAVISVFANAGPATNTWTFDTAGTITLPNGANIRTVDELTIINSTTTANGVIGINARESATGESVAQIYLDGADRVARVSTYNPDTEIGYDWTFDAGGSFTLPTSPGNVYFGTNSNGPVILADSLGITLNGNRADTEQDYVTVSQDGVNIFSVNTINIENNTTGLLNSDINLRSGDDILLQGRDKADDTEAEGGDINIWAGDGASSTGVGNDTGGGGDVQIQGGLGGSGTGTGVGAASGGFVSISGGDGGTSVDSNAGSGGALTLSAGSAAGVANTALGGVGGSISITAGDTTRIDEIGGTISLTTGAASGDGTGAAGYVEINIPSSNVGPGGTWTFGGTGTTLNVPGNAEIYGANFGNLTVGCAGNTIVTSSVYGSGNVKNWVFGSTGDLTLPDSGNINSGTANANVALNAFSSAGNLVSIQAQGDTSSAVISIFSNAGPVTSNWTFTTAPLDPSESYLYVPNGGAITTPDATGGEGGKNIFIYAGASDPVTWNSNSGGELMLKGGYGSFGDGGGGPGGNVNINGGESSDSHAGNVNITAGASRYWTFDYSGNLSLPPSGNIVGLTANNNGYLNWFGNSSGDGAGYTTMRLVPDDTRESADQYLIIDPTAPGHIHIRAGGTQDNSNADLILGGENSYFKIAAGSNSQATISSNSNAWVFNTDGNLQVPGNINGDNSAPLVIDGASSGEGFIRLPNTAFGGEQVAIVNQFSLGNGIVLTTNGGNLFFDNNGDLTAPGNITGNTAGYALGYRDIPQVIFAGNATIATTDAGKHFYSTESTDYTLTIANNASQGFQVGAAITVVNQGTGNITIAQGSGVTLYLAGNATAGNRSVATFGMATIMKVATDTWFINGTGVS